MAELSLNLPVVGEKDTTAEPKVTTALSEIQTQFNGKVAAVNLEAKAVTEAKLATALVEKVTPTITNIATEQERENAAYGTLTTPDQVTLVMPENGLIAIGYQASWAESSKNAARAALFIGANQLKVARAVVAGPAVSEAGTGGSNSVSTFSPLVSCPLGLAAAEASESAAADVTTGQAIGVALSGGGFLSVGGSVIAFNGMIGGICYVFAAAATYTISVQFKASAGNVKVKNRKLWAWVV